MSLPDQSATDAAAGDPVSGVQFILDGQVHRVAELPATTTVLDYLREHLQRCGTKEGCAEGDCGACTVVLGELTEDAQAIRYRAINSCIRFLPTLDGKSLLTSESLADGEKLHPVQQALVDQHASQCGFCTPGFVMSLFALYQNDPQPNREAVVDALAGNLCRCTGYRPIIDAGCAMHRYPAPTHLNPADAQSHARIAALKSIQRKQPLKQADFLAPRTLAQLADAYLAQPDALILAGGTDIGLWVTQQQRQLPPLISIGEVQELAQIHVDDAQISIGAAVPLSEAWPVLVQEYPALAEIAQRFASPPVCNSGTLCGNLANGSPIGDAPPVLIALGAELVLRRGSEQRRLPLEDLYLGYQRKAFATGEFIAAVNIPRAATHSGGQHFVAAYKLAKRHDQDISAVCAAFAVTLSAGLVRDVRIAFGGMAAIPARARRTEAALRDQAWNTHTIDAACAVLAEEFAPLDDLRGSAAYRRHSAVQMLRRFSFSMQIGGQIRTDQTVPLRLADLDLIGPLMNADVVNGSAGDDR